MFLEFYFPTITGVRQVMNMIGIKDIVETYDLNYCKLHYYKPNILRNMLIILGEIHF